MGDRRLRPSARLVLGLILAAGALAHGCGRTSLDDGFGPDDSNSSGGASGIGGQAGGGFPGIGGQAGGGLAGMSGGGLGGTVVPPTITCGTGKCVTGMQSCCNRIDPTGRAVQMCIAVSDPTGCLDGVVLCSADILCPKAAPSCCIQALGVGYCQPAGLPCTPLRP